MACHSNPLANVSAILRCALTAWVFACATSCADSTSDSAATPGTPLDGANLDANAADFIGRYSMLTRSDRDDDADIGRRELTEQDGELSLTYCSGGDRCDAESWTCTPSTDDYSGPLDAGQLRMSTTFTDDGVEFAADMELWSMNEGTLRGTITATPCPDGRAQCVAVVLACDVSKNMVPQCDGTDFSGLRNCECVNRDELTGTACL